MSLSVTGSNPIKGSPAPGADKRTDLITAEQAMVLIEPKMASRYRSVREAFIRMDTDVDGFIGPDELRTTMDHLGLRLSGREFRRFWRLFDTSGDDRIDYVEFNNKVGNMINPMSLGLQFNRPETPQMKEWQKKTMAARIRKQVNDIESTFREMDTDNSGLISQAEFISALRAMGVRGVGDSESWSMMQRFKHPGNNTGQMTFPEFKECMNEMLHVGSHNARRDADGEAAIEALEVVEKALEKRVPRDVNAAREAFSRHDVEGLGDLSHEQLKAAWESIAGISLSTIAMEAIISKYDSTADGSVGIHDLAKIYAAGKHGGRGVGGVGGGFLTGADAFWPKLGIRPAVDQVSGQRLDMRKLPRVIGPRVGMNESETALAQALLGRFAEIKKVLLAADKDHSGDVTKVNFKNALDSMGLTFTDDAISSIAPRFDRMKSGRIAINDFLSMYQKYINFTDQNITLLGFERIPAATTTTTTTSTTSAAAASLMGNAATKGNGAGGGAGSRRPIVAQAASTSTIRNNNTTINNSDNRQAAAVAAAASGRLPSKLHNNMSSSSHTSSGGVLSHVGKSIASPTHAVGGRARTDNYEQFDDATSVGTQGVDVNATARRIVRGLGGTSEGLDRCVNDIRRTAVKETTRAIASASAMPGAGASTLWATTGAGGGAAAVTRGAFITADGFRDVLASHGVPLTGRDVRALATRYGNRNKLAAVVPGARGGGLAAGVSTEIDVERLVKDLSSMVF